MTTGANSGQSPDMNYDYRQILMTFASRLINVSLDQFDSIIHELLKRIGDYSGVDRAYIFRHDYKRGVTSKSHEWCAFGVAPAVDGMQDLPLDSFGDMQQVGGKGKSPCIFIVDELSANTAVKKSFKLHGVSSFVVAPLSYQGNIYGLVGFDTLSGEGFFSGDHINILNDLSLVVINAFQRQESEEALKKQKERLTNILDGTSAGIWEWNVQTGETFYSDKYAQILGYKLEEMDDISYKKWEQITHPDDLKISNEMHEKHFRGEVEYYDCEYRMKHKDGHWVWVHDQGKVITRTPDGQPLQVFGILMDITRRRESEEELRSTKQMLELIINNIPQFIFWKDRNSVYLGCNENQARVAGLESPEEIIGKTDYDLPWSREEAEHYRRVDQQVMKSGQPKYHILETQKQSDGHRAWLDTNKIPLFNNEGKVFGILGTYEDITERKKAQEELLASETRNRALIETIPDLMFRYNRNGDYLDAWINDLDLLHPQSRKDFIETGFDGKNIRDVLPVEISALLLKGIKAALDTEELQIIEYQYEDEGELFYKEARLVAAGKNEVISIVRNITDKKKYEVELQYLSLHDRLTGLYNRHYLESEMERLDTSRQLPISIIMADLNGLKLVNDTYGHSRGDQMLREASRILQSVCRREDIISRWGGDEFVIVLPNTSPDKAQLICKRITRKCQGAFIEDIPLSIAMGVSAKVNHEKGLIEILREAEDAMYKQKLTESRSIKNAVLQALLKTLAEKSYETEAHTMGMIEMAQKMGNALELSDVELNQLVLVITLHDIGKINIAEEILTKSGPLTEDEWQMIKKHPEIGFRIARATEDFAHVAKEILSHHERWDGTGYPEGLKGRQIPLLSRITSVVDAYEVMSNGRPYKKAMSKDEIVAEFKRCSGNQFDPALVNILLEQL